MPSHRPSSLPKYRLHRPRGLAVVALNGRDYYLGPHKFAESRQEYDRLLAEWLASGRQFLKASEEAHPTIGQLLVQYYEFA